MKKSLIALAVAATVAAPLTTMAASHGDAPTVYGGFRVDLVSAGGDLDISNGSSRYGIKGSHDLGNGLSSFYRLERSLSADTATVPEGGRLSYVGLKGGFGSVSLGQQWSPYYGAVGSPSDVFAGNFLPFYAGTYRLGNSLAYGLPGGAPVSGGIALVIDDGGSTDEDDLDAINAGFSFAAGPMKIGLGIHDAASAADTIVGLSIGGKFGGAGVTLMIEDAGDNTPVSLTGTFGGFAVQYVDADDDAGDSAVTLGYTHKLSKNTRIQFAARDKDSAADVKLVARLRVDF